MRSLFDTDENIGEPIILPGELDSEPDEPVKTTDKPADKKPVQSVQTPTEHASQPPTTGTDIKPGDEVNMMKGLPGTHAGHEDETFVVATVTPFDACKSGFNIIAELKSNRQIRTVGMDGRGLDANWFKKIV